MHYKNGRAARIGDRVVALWNEKPFIGIVIDANPGSTSCNLSVAPLPITNSTYVTAAEAMHVEDAVNLNLVPNAPNTQ